MDGSSLRQSARASTSFLTSALDLDWDRSIPDMTWPVREVLAHISEGLIWYSADLSAGTTELGTMRRGTPTPGRPCSGRTVDGNCSIGRGRRTGTGTLRRCRSGDGIVDVEAGARRG